MTTAAAGPPDPVFPDADLEPAYLELALAVRQFAAAELAPFAREVDEKAVFRREMVASLAGAGVLGGPIATTYGGRGWDPLQLAVAHEEIGAVCGNARGFLAVQTGLVAQCLESFGDDEQRQRWLPGLVAGTTIGCFALTEEEAGSDIASLACRATRTGDAYRFDGKKIWTTNGSIADLALLFATTDPELGHQGITCFLVDLDQPGIERLPMPGIELGHRGSSHAQLVFQGATAGRRAVLGGEGEGFKVAMGGLGCGRLSVAAGAVGIHRAALQASIAFVREREQFGRKLAAFQMVQERIADMTVELLAARALVHRCAQRRRRGIDRPADIAAAKLYATEAAGRAADTAIQLHGGRGYTSAQPVERLLRDSIGLRIYEGTSMIQKSILARAVLRDPTTPAGAGPRGSTAPAGEER